MCMSRLHRVTGRATDGALLVGDVDGAVHRVSLLALDGPEPEPGDWLVVHSGYAIERVDRDEAEAIAAELRDAVRRVRGAAGGQDDDDGRGRP